ncbi:MAG: DNA recombination protein RmuC [Candidatus Methanoplasma sp.]|jgi:DNA recombination protein RmuC|nr:DNA recombination protein RmuC [Candidatus Methanoplasma sp.]
MDAISLAILAAVAVLTAVNLIITVRNRNVSGGGHTDRLAAKIDRLDELVGRQAEYLQREFRQNREENHKASRESREEQTCSFKQLSDGLSASVEKLSQSQEKQFVDFNEQQGKRYGELLERQEKTENGINIKLGEIREENAKKLDEMRKTVDENLKETVEKRFNESFKLVSERLEKVHEGLGEMKTLASEVGNLKNVLTNVKTRGGLGEIQLGSILEQILSPEQYACNVATKKGSQERVEYAILLPDKNREDGNLILPIDSKFPMEDYQRLTDAYGNPEGQNIDVLSRGFENAVKRCARDIRDKYINPPYTTDFAVMFVPTEGLYAEIVRRNVLFEDLRNNYNVTVVGPTNLSAFLSSLQMGFRTLAIQRRSVEVWEILGKAKTEFGKFGDVLDKVKNNLDRAARDIDGIGTRTRAIERSLRVVDAAQFTESADGQLEGPGDTED